MENVVSINQDYQKAVDFFKARDTVITIRTIDLKSNDLEGLTDDPYFGFMFHIQMGCGCGGRGFAPKSDKAHLVIKAMMLDLHDNFLEMDHE